MLSLRCWNPKVHGDNGECSSMEEKERAKNEIRQIIDSVIANTTSAPTMSTMIHTHTCNGTPGWRRVAFINMTDTSYNCPTWLNLTSYSKRTYGRSHTTRQECSSTTFSVGGLPYSRVCGRIRGYQFGEANAFSGLGIDSSYVTPGISLTHGIAGRHQHIWTFAVGASEVVSLWSSSVCPCDAFSTNRVPAFVGNADYFCESGFHSAGNVPYILFPDILWDGQNCTSTSTCYQFNNPPWFAKNLPNVTTDDIELRLCTYGTPDYDDVPIELIELYVQWCNHYTILSHNKTLYCT